MKIKVFILFLIMINQSIFASFERNYNIDGDYIGVNFNNEYIYNLDIYTLETLQEEYPELTLEEILFSVKDIVGREMGPGGGEGGR